MAGNSLVLSANRQPAEGESAAVVRRLKNEKGID